MPPSSQDISWRVEPTFLAGNAGPLHATLFASRTPRVESSAILVFAPFAEEMNKSRPMIAAFAHQATAIGMDVLIVDPFGTGDSAGDFSEATWEQWIDDFSIARQQLIRRGAQHVHILAIRTGALFLDSVLADRDTGESKLILWQPVIRGADFWRQFLRLRIAADAMRDQNKTELPPQEQLRRDGSIEIAGYFITARLADALVDRVLSPTTVGKFREALWAEVSLNQPPTLSATAQRTLALWRASEIAVREVAVSGESFWSTPEISFAPELVESSVAFLQS